MKLAVIIPCYNERDNIPLIVERISVSFAGRNDVEVILVDNGSTDGTDAILTTLLEGQDNIRCVKVEQNVGYGHGILFGLISVIDADVYAWTHADMQTDPKDVLTAFDLLRDQGFENIVVKGKRKNRAIRDVVFTFLMQAIANRALNVKLDDINAQPKVFSKRFFESYIRDQAPIDFSLDLFLLYQAYKAGFDILEVEVAFKNRLYGEAKGGGGWLTRIKLIKRTLMCIFRLWLMLKNQAKNDPHTASR